MQQARLLRALLSSLVLLVVVAAALPAQPPAGYYDTVDTTDPASLRTTLHDVIDDHIRFPYTAATTDTWDILNLADEDPNNTANIIDVYKNASYTKISGGTGAYNREHTWPKSYGFPNDNSSNYPYTDCHMLFLSDSGYNSSRSNKPYRTCHSGCTEKTTDFNDGRGGGSGVYPGNSSWTEGSFTQGTWETWGGRKGDVARAILYMDVRYEGGTHGGSGASEPDLIAVDNESLIDSSNTGSNESVAYMGMLAELLQWHQDDPVDSREVWRNEVVYTYQGNRNPFIDHPEWVRCVFQSDCTFDSTPPAAPTGLLATAGDGQVDLSWNPNGEPDLDGYNVYRATTSGGPYAKVNPSLVAGTSYSDTGLVNGTTYYYVVTAVDASANESGDSNEASATPEVGPDVTPPANPTGLAAGGGDSVVNLSWDANTEPDLDGYNVYRATASGGPYGQLNGPLVASPSYSDTTVTNGTTYFYVVTAVDASGNESGDSNEASATPNPVTIGVVLSEVFYDPAGGDNNFEWVELYNAGATTVDLSTYSLGNGGTDYTYSTVALSGTIAPGATFVVGGRRSTSANGNPSFDLKVNFDPDFQNSGSAADGVALFDVPEAQITGSTVPIDAVVYGPANTNALIDETGAANPPEVGDAPSGSSIERVDPGGAWQIQATPTPNQAHAGLGGSGGDTTPPAAPSGLTASAGNGSVSLDWQDNGEPDLDGYNVYRSTTAGGPYSQINGGTVTASDYVDNGVSNGTTYYYVVTAVDTSANESADSNEASATPQGGGATTMYVQAIDLSTVGGGKKKGRAEVTIVDNLGNPVSGATVSGTFTGVYNESGSAGTDAAGLAKIDTSAREKEPISFTFCVDTVTHGSLSYDAGSNVETCDSF